MTVEILIQAIVRQTAVLVAQLATTGGVRAPLAQIANRVFIDLARELERLGVNRKVSADMFGLGLRTYRRKIQRVGEISADGGRSLREDILRYLKAEGLVTRLEILDQFPNDDEAQIRAVLRDLRDNQLVLTSGKGTHMSYRAATDEELAALKRKRGNEGDDDLHVALIYREGPLTAEEIAERAQTETSGIQGAIERLVQAGRIRKVENEAVPKYRADALVIPLGATFGWEAAVFDHFKAMIGTVINRVQNNKTDPATLPAWQNTIGGSTYTIDVWKDHPLEQEVLGTLSQVRNTLSELRTRVNRINAEQHPQSPTYRVVIYAGQDVVTETSEDEA